MSYKFTGLVNSLIGNANLGYQSSKDIEANIMK